MEKALRAYLSKSSLTTKYKSKKLSDGIYNVTLPFVATIGDKLSAIKPLAFQHETANQIIDHGERWVSRIKRLINNEILSPQRLLLAVEGPSETYLFNAYSEVISELKDTKVNIVSYEDKASILTFAGKELEPESFKLS